MSGMSYEQGDIVLMYYPNTDLSTGKKRPALVVSNSAFNSRQDDLITCLITSNIEQDPLGVIIDFHDLSEGSLPVRSRIKPYRIFTAKKGVIEKKLGVISKRKLNETFEKIQKVIRPAVV
ncbi:MAG: type II toxin-antitoxin system PemK/MazF family toxin [Candidatus Diapherotrites archaeon]